MESVGLLITLVLVKQLLGDPFVSSYFSSVSELSAVKMQISISIKATIPAKKAYMMETQIWFYSVTINQLKVAGEAFFAEKIRVVFAAARFQQISGLQQSGVVPLEVAAEHGAALRVPAGGMSVAVKNLANVKNPKAKSINVLSQGQFCATRGLGVSSYFHKMSKMKLFVGFLKVFISLCRGKNKSKKLPSDCLN